MPIIPSSFVAKGLFKNGHFSTIYSAKLRPTPKVVQERERIELTDGDFLHLDWSYATKSVRKLIVILHGLEGNAQRTYVKAQAYLFNKKGYDVAAVNFRGCSGEDNVFFSSYHSGKSDDLHQILYHILETDRFDHISIVGFSLGGNLALKYFGEQASKVPNEIKSVVAISAPVYLKGSLERLMKFENRIYSQNFLHDLRKKYSRKIIKHPESATLKDLKQIKTLLDFDNIYTAPAHGFKDAFDYYEQSSSLQFLPSIERPVLLLNARNDSFLSEKCYPYDIATDNKNLYLETPKHGGHVGFHLSNALYYSEKRAYEFIYES